MVAKNIEDNIKKFFSKRNIKADRRLIVYLIFVALATIFWFLLQLEDEYETEISLPIRYSNFPVDKILVNELPDHFILNVKGHGFKLLEYKISNKFLPFPINVNNLTLKMHSRSSYVKFFALSKNLNIDIQRWLDSDLKIMSISPDSLFFDFADRIFKKVPVESQLNIIPATQFLIRGEIAFSPDSIIISGAKPIVDTINSVYTRKQDLLDLKANYDDDIKLEKIDNIDFSEDNVDIAINIEKFTEGSKKVRLNTLNIPDSLVLRTFPNEINVTYFVALSDYDKVLPQLFEVAVDYKDINTQGDKLNVKILNSPEYVRSLRFDPETVEYIIEKK